MKQLIKLYTPDEVKSFVNTLWKTKFLLYGNDGSPISYIQEWVDKFSQHPTVFAEMSEPELEYPHFGTWFGLTYLRHYDNDLVSDLYYLHEIVHAVLTSYKYMNDTFTSWYRRINTTEFSASLETEANIYLEIPKLRPYSFADRIWADRFIDANLPKDELKNLMRQERYRAMREPDPMDYCEQQIAAYGRQNFEWANIWKLNVTLDEIKIPAFEHVEKHMYAFRHNKLTLDEHIAWLQKMGDVPFPDQARLFSDVYWRNKLGYKKG